MRIGEFATFSEIYDDDNAGWVVLTNVVENERELDSGGVVAYIESTSEAAGDRIKNLVGRGVTDCMVVMTGGSEYDIILDGVVIDFDEELTINTR